MKKLFVIITFLMAMLYGTSCVSYVHGQNKTPMNELPMYGNKTKPPEMLKADREFIDGMVKQFGSRKKASAQACKVAWQYIEKQDWSTATKRLNQAWLLNPENAHVFWGYGVVMASRGKYEEGIKYFTKADKLEPGNGRLICDYGFLYQIYGIRGSETRKEAEPRLDRAIDLYRKASLAKPDYDRTYFNWAVSLYYKEDFRGAWSKIKEAEKYGGGSISQEFIKDLTKKMPRPKGSS